MWPSWPCTWLLLRSSILIFVSSVYHPRPNYGISLFDWQSKCWRRKKLICRRKCWLMPVSPFFTIPVCLLSSISCTFFSPVKETCWVSQLKVVTPNRSLWHSLIFPCRLSSFFFSTIFLVTFAYLTLFSTLDSLFLFFSLCFFSSLFLSLSWLVPKLSFFFFSIFFAFTFNQCLAVSCFQAHWKSSFGVPILKN